MKNSILQIIKYWVICVLTIGCTNNSEFEKALLKNNGAWNVFAKYENDSIAKYEYSIIFYKDKSWDSYIRNNLNSESVIKPVYIDDVKGISEWVYYKKDSAFIMGEDKQFKILKIKDDSLFLEPINYNKVQLIFVKDYEGNVKVSDIQK